MIMDAQLQFSSAQAVTAAAGSTNVIDLAPLTGGTGTNLGRDIGTGQVLYIVVSVNTTLTDAGANTGTTVTIETDDNSGFASPTTAQTIGTFAQAAVAGSRFVAKLQPIQIDERYVRLKYTPLTANLTGGKFDAFITEDAQLFKTYASGFSVLG